MIYGFFFFWRILHLLHTLYSVKEHRTYECIHIYLFIYLFLSTYVCTPSTIVWFSLLKITYKLCVCVFGLPNRYEKSNLFKLWKQQPKTINFLLWRYMCSVFEFHTITCVLYHVHQAVVTLFIFIKPAKNRMCWMLLFSRLSITIDGNRT